MNANTVLFLLGFFTIVSLDSKMVSAEPDEEEGKVELSIVQSVETRREKPLDEALASVSVATSTDIEVQNPTAFNEVLRDFPGVQVQETGSFGESVQIRIRGSEEPQVLFLLEGIRINDPFRGGLETGNFTANEFAQAEVLRGGYSTLYGSDAIAGVIQMRLKRGEGPLQATLGLDGGGLRTFRETVSVGGGSQGGDFLASYSRLDSAGQYDHDRYRSDTFNGSFSLKTGNRGRIYWGSRIQSDRKEAGQELVGVGPTAFQVFPDDDNQVERLFSFQTLQYDYRVFEKMDLSFKTAYYRNDLSVRNPSTPLFMFPDYFESTRTETVFLNFQNNVQLTPRNGFSFGVEWERQSVESGIELASTPFPVDEKRRTGAGFFEYNFRLEELLQLQAGYRVDYSSVFERVESPRVSGAFRVSRTGTRIRAAWGTGFRGPTIQDLFFPLLGNPELRPEKSISREAGFSQPLLQNKLKIDMVYFRTDFRDLIQRSPTGVENIGKALTHGLESGLVWKVHSIFEFGGNFTYLKARSKSGNQELPFRPARRGNIFMLLTPSPVVSARVDWNTVSHQQLGFFVGDQYFPLSVTREDGSTIENQSPGYGRVDLSLNYTHLRPLGLLREARAYLKLLNLFNRKYEDIPGFPNPGFLLMAGIKGNF